jgi:hypothetical protein
MAIKVITTAHGSRNIAIEMSGFLTSNEHDGRMFKLHKFEEHSLKVSAVLFLIQEKGGLHLWWDKDNLLLPLESRGSFKLDARRSPEGWDGQLWGSAFKIDEPKGFLVILDFDK